MWWLLEQFKQGTPFSDRQTGAQLYGEASHASVRLPDCLRPRPPPPPSPAGTLLLDIPPFPPQSPPHSSRRWMGHLHALCLWSCTVVVYDRSTCRWRHKCCLISSTYQPSYAFLVSVALTFAWWLVLPFASLFPVCGGVASGGGCDRLPGNHANSR